MIIQYSQDRSARYFHIGLDYMLHRPFRRKWFEKEAPINVDDDMIIFIATPSIQSQDWLKKKINLVNEERSGDLSRLLVCFVDYLPDSSLNSQYLRQRLMKGLKVKNEFTVITVDFIEADYALALEDEYNHCYSFKNLSRYYKKQLKKVILLASRKVEDKTTESMVKQKGETYGNRSLV